VPLVSVIALPIKDDFVLSQRWLWWMWRRLFWYTSTFEYEQNYYNQTQITNTWERPTRCTLFLINLFQLNYLLHVSNK